MNIIKTIWEFIVEEFTGTTTSRGPCAFTGRCDECGAPVGFSQFGIGPFYRYRRQNMTKENSEKIKKFCQDYSDTDENMFVKKIKEKGLTDQDIVSVIAVIETTCLYCLDGDNDCMCMRDD